MSGFEIKGWCPGAHRPMMSGDGLVVRVRPHSGRLSAREAAGLADAAELYGNGLIDLSARANLQVRGVAEQNHAPLLAALDRLGLLDADPQAEARRNIIVAPFWTDGDETSTIAGELEKELSRSGLALPGKFGFAVDCGNERVLHRASADIRVERCSKTGLIVRPDGAERGRPVSRDEAAGVAIALAEWFAASSGIHDGRGRMAAHIAKGAEVPKGLAGRHLPAPVAAPPAPGRITGGTMAALPFGQVRAQTLHALAELGQELRMTPWRMIYILGVADVPSSFDFIMQADDPLLGVAACTGAPGCSQAHAETRSLARALAPHVPAGARLHVSGCTKGCAHPGPASFTLVAAREGFDLVCDGTASCIPALRRIAVEALAASPTSYLRAD